MADRELLYTPKKRGLFKRSPLYGIAMFAKSFAICSEYLMSSNRALLTSAETDAYIARFWHIHFEGSKTTLFVTGRELLTPGASYVFMSNHESWLDIPAMFAAVPSGLRMVSKIELMKLPVVGQAMLNAGFIAVDRRNRNKAIRQLEHAKDRLRSGLSIWIAPEGTRSRDGSLLPFKKGGFHLARDLGKPIVPVYIEGAAQVMPSDSLWVYPNKSITVHFCEPIPTTSYDRSNTTELIEVVREAILKKKKECQQNYIRPEATE